MHLISIYIIPIYIPTIYIQYCEQYMMELNLSKQIYLYRQMSKYYIKYVYIGTYIVHCIYNDLDFKHQFVYIKIPTLAAAGWIL